MMTTRTPSSGFTMIELLVTLSIAAIMVTLAVPSFSTFLLNNRLTSQTNDLVLALASARSEAVKRGISVTVCSRATDSTCAGSTTWNNGWLVFVDNDGDGTKDVDDTEILNVRSSLEGSNTLTGARARVIFQNTGTLGALSNGTFRLCDSRGTGDAKSIAVSMQGRATSSDGASACP